MSNSALPLSVMLALPPLDLSSKEITPPSEPPTPPLAVMFALAAVVVSMKANVVADSPAPKPPPMTKVALSAVAMLSNKMKPPCSPLVLPPTVVKVPSPARRLHLIRQRSEEHTSELQSRENLVCRLLLEKKKKIKKKKEIQKY